MTIDEAIKHAEKVAEQNEWFDKNCLESMQCRECAEEHRQLADWLKDYKRLLDQEQKWIPVGERLPDIHNYFDSYLVTLKRGGIHIAMFTECNGKHWWSYDDVVAWMYPSLSTIQRFLSSYLY